MLLQPTSPLVSTAPAVVFETQELHFRIPSTAILTRSGRRFAVFEAHYSNRIFRELRRIQREGEQIAGLICEQRGALDRSSIRAFNVYLRNVRLCGVNRWDWADLGAEIGLRWSR